MERIVRKEGQTCCLVTMDVITNTETLYMKSDIWIDKIVALETDITLWKFMTIKINMAQNDNRSRMKQIDVQFYLL
jgi:hypothetical protein